MIEVDEVICTTLPHRRPRLAWCSDCGAEVVMLAPQEAAGIAQVSVREVNRRVEAGQLHFLETAEGLLLVCMNSLGTMGSRGLLIGKNTEVKS